VEEPIGHDEFVVEQELQLFNVSWVGSIDDGDEEIALAFRERMRSRSHYIKCDYV
jgi:hypothetical protein